MKAFKVWKKLLAGVLCASMLFQAVPSGVLASEPVCIDEAQTQSEPEEHSLTNESTAEELEVQEPEAEDEAQETETVTASVAEPKSETQADTVSVEESQPEQTETLDTDTAQTEGGTQTIQETETAEMTTQPETMESEPQETLSDNEEDVLADDDMDLIDYTKLVMATENTYYCYKGTLYIIMKLSGCEIPQDVTMEFSVDDKPCGKDAGYGEVIQDPKQEGYYIIKLDKKQLVSTSSNAHTMSLALTRLSASGEKRELVKRQAVFTVVEQEIFLEKTPYYMGVSDDSVEVTIFNTADDIERIALSNNGETVAAPTKDSVVIKEPIKTDPRYTGICSGYVFPEVILPQTGVLLYKSVWTLTNLKNAIDLGNYNLNLVFTNEETMDISNAVSITADAVVTNCTIAVDYDNTSPYAYLFIQGSGFNPADVNFNFKAGSSTGTPLNSMRVSSKEVWSGYIVKFKKNGNWPKAGESIYVSLSGHNIRFSKSEFTSPVKTGIYYAAYNPVLKAVEVGVAVDLNGKRTQFSIVRKTGGQDEVYSTTSNSLTESLIYLTPQGSLEPGEHFVRLVVDGDTAHPYSSTEFNIDEKVLSTNRWDAPKVISQNAERHYFYYYCEEAGITSSDLSAKITAEQDGASRDAVVSATEWLREDAGRGTNIKVVIPTQKLKIGKYKVEIFKHKEGTTQQIAFYDFELVEAKNRKFVLDEYSISWINDDTMQVYIKTPNCSEEDDFDIKLTRTDGREVEDLKSEITNRYSDSIYMEVTGLKRTKAFRDYYVLLTHKNKDYEDFGYPFMMSDMTKSYYTDSEKQKGGQLKTIAFNRGMPIKVTANNRVVGINLQYMALPATVNLYAPNDTTVLTDLTITAATEDDYYYFTKEFYNTLPNKDTLYDMVISDADGWGRTYPGVTIGYREEIIQNDFKAEITTDILFLGVEGEDSAVITVTGNKQKPTFEAKDESIVTVEADEENANKAVVHAAEKTGTTVVTIFADGVEKNIIVTVTAKVDGIVLDASSRHMWVGDTFDVKVYTLPMGSEDDTHRMTFVSSDPNVLYVKQLSATTAKITAIGSGTATLRVSLNGTAHVTNMSVSVTGLFSLTEKKAKIAEAGIGSYIENVDRTLEYCELPEGWQWDDGSISLSASDDATVQYYGATYTQEGYASFSARLPVAVTRITGINIEGRSLINRGKEEVFKVSYEYVGRSIIWEEIDERLSVNCVKISDGDIAQVTSVDKKQIVITTKEESDGGVAEFRFTLSIDNGTLEGNDMLARTFSITVPLEDCVDNIVLTPVKTAEQSFTFLPEKKLMEVDVNEVKRVDGKYPVSIALAATINEVPAKNITYEWASDDETVASFTVDKKTGKLVTDKDGNVVLTIKSVGIVQITAVAGDPGAFVGTLTINVMDYEPVVESAVITVNKNNTIGTPFALQEQNGNSIKKVRVLEQNAESPSFSAKLPVNGMSVMTIRDNSPAKGYGKKTSTNATLEVETIKGGRYQYPITIVTEVTLPTAAIKLKQKANLFYRDAAAVYTISSNYEIASVKDAGSQNYKERFYGTYNKNSKTVTFGTKGTLDRTTIGLFTDSKSPRLETRLEVRFVGYNEPQYIDVKVKTENKKPKYSSTSLTICPGMISGAVDVVDAKTKKKLVLKSASMQLTMPKSVNGLEKPSINAQGGMSITYYGGKSTSYTVALQNNEWTQDVDIKGKINYVKSPDKLTLALGSRQLTLNMGTNMKDHGINRIPVSVSGNDVKIIRMTYDGTAKALIDDKRVLYYEFSTKRQAIDLGLVKDSQSAVKPGSYKLDLYATIAVGDSEVTIKKASLTIKIADTKAAKVALSSPKGKINLVERNATSIVYTPKVSGIESPVRSVKVTGDSQKFFTAVLNQDQKIEVKAKAGIAGMSSKTTYKVTVQSTLENGYQIETDVKIKPVNKLPKIVLSPKEGNLYRGNSNKYVTALSLQNSSLGLNSISGITFDVKGQNAEQFSLSNDLIRNGTISFGLAGDKLSVKKGTYKLACQVRFKDADAEAKPVTVNVTVTVK